FEGRISQEERLKKRFTLPDLVKRIEEQVGYLKRDDFYTVPFSAPLSELASVFTNSPKVTFSAHPHCGIATFLFVEDGSIIPITRFINVEKLMKDALKIANSIETSKLKKIAKIKALKLLVENYIDKKNAPKGLNIRSILFDILSKGKKESLSKFTWKTLMIGGMHFQDCYNYDVERVMRCAVHYPVPDGRIIPFCAYNSGPCYREEIEKKYSVTIEDWKKNSKENCNIKDFPFLAEV
ncbi:MAG: radical SAM protein, partial [Candidatus Thermoplasmatota archaeon]